MPASADVVGGAATKRNGNIKSKEYIDAEEGEEEEVQLGLMDMGDWTTPNAQVLLSTDTRGETQG